MAADQAQHAKQTAAIAAPDGDDDADLAIHDDGAPDAWSSWANLWQVPAITVSLLLIVFGLYVAGLRRPANDFQAALDEIDRLIAVGDFDDARQRLQDVVEPNLETATPAEQARYHATVADWVAASQELAGVSAHENNRVIADRYTLAVDGSAVLSAPRLERWANALIDLGDTEGARDRIAELEALGVTDDGGDDARGRRNRLLRRLVGANLRQDDLSEEALFELLASYRRDPMLEPGDRAWAAAREAELWLELGDANEAVKHLLLDMRRLERVEAPIGPELWSELYTLLGRAYYDQSLFDHAIFYLRRALACVEGSGAAAGEAHLLLGRIDMARGDLEEALARFDTVVREFESTEAYLPAVLARAESASILGRHAESLADYRTLLELLPSVGPRRDVSRRSVASSLADRHDAALTMGDLDRALEYVGLAEALYDGASVPHDVTRRIASTSRQIADNLMATALAAPGARLELVDPAVRHEASRRYERAAEYFLRHARAVAALPDQDETWAESLRLCGDSYDRAGLRREAITHFLEYLAGRPVDDPVRADVTFQLAQAYEAEEEFDAAARTYQQVIDEHGRSTFGTRSLVPLARSLLALGKRDEAERVLVGVVGGRPGTVDPLTPEAADYRDALLALGRLYYDEGRTAFAIERLTVAAQRYPDDDRIDQIRYRLADSHRRHAATLREEIQTAARLSPGDRRQREALAEEHLEAALGLFTQVVEGYGQRQTSMLNRLERDMERFASLYRADSAYALGLYEDAAELYDQAARRYSTHRASMHALVQIVNCFERLGRSRDAEIAHQNALTRLRQLPDDAFDDPDALMDRTAWERWLQDRPVGLARGSGAVLN